MTGPRRSQASETGTPHNEARDQIWEALVTILLDKHVQDEEVADDVLRRSLQQNRQLRAAFSRAWPLLDAAGLVGDLWSVPASCRDPRPGSAPMRSQHCNARTPVLGRCPTCRSSTRRVSGSATPRHPDASVDVTPRSRPNAR